jgi:hypothetical protein
MSTPTTTRLRTGRGASRIWHGPRAVVSTIGLAAVVALFATLTPGAAGAASSGSGSGSGSTAVVTPLLEFFEFGNTIGLPLLCSDAGSVASIIGSQAGGAALSSPLVTVLNDLCSELATKGTGYLQQAITESQGLSLINPVVNPLLAAMATGITTMGTEYEWTLGPFGPTVAGLGGTVAFFEGT